MYLSTWQCPIFYTALNFLCPFYISDIHVCKTWIKYVFCMYSLIILYEWQVNSHIHPATCALINNNAWCTCSTLVVVLVSLLSWTQYFFCLFFFHCFLMDEYFLVSTTKRKVLKEKRKSYVLVSFSVWCVQETDSLVNLTMEQPFVC